MIEMEGCRVSTKTTVLDAPVNWMLPASSCPKANEKLMLPGSPIFPITF